MTRIVLVRHGQTEWNRIERFRGRMDIELNVMGLAQAKKTAKRIQASWKPELIYSSPLKRAMQTAEAVANLAGIPANPEENLIDIDYGEWQGLTPDEARLRWPDEISAWYHLPEQAHIPGGESLFQVQNRAMSFVKSLDRSFPNQTLLLLSHTVVNRLILLGILGLGPHHFWRLRQEPCAINLIEVNGEGLFIVTMNDTCHLEE